MLLHNAVTDAQPQPGSFSHRLRGVKRVKHAMRLLDSRPGIRKQNHHAPAIAQGLDRHHAAALSHRVQPVVHDVEENLHQLVVVASHARQHGFQFRFSARSCTALVITELISSNVRSGGTCRAKLRRFCTRLRVLRACSRIFPAVVRARSGKAGSSANRSEYPSIAVSGLLISCAAPAANWPSEISFSDCTICACKRCRFSIEDSDLASSSARSLSARCVRRNTSRTSGTAASSVTVKRKSRIALVSCSRCMAYSAKRGSDSTAPIASREAQTCPAATPSVPPATLPSDGRSSCVLR